MLMHAAPKWDFPSQIYRCRSGFCLGMTARKCHTAAASWPHPRAGVDCGRRAERDIPVCHGEDPPDEGGVRSACRRGCHGAWEDGGVSVPLVDEAIKKAAIAWVSVGDGPALGRWCMPYESGPVVVSGPGEQAAPGLAEATVAGVRLRGDNGGLIVITEATVTRVTPG